MLEKGKPLFRNFRGRAELYVPIASGHFFKLPPKKRVPPSLSHRFFSLVPEMSDDEVDEELLALLRQSLECNGNNVSAPAQTRVLEGSEYVYDNSIDVALDYKGCKEAASMIWTSMQEKKYSIRTWSDHELHPKVKDASTMDFIFTMDLLNFSFWSDRSNAEEKFAVEFRGKLWTGYWSLVAALQRALEEGAYFMQCKCHMVLTESRHTNY